MAEETMVETLERLRKLGYEDDFRASGASLCALVAKRTYAPETLMVDEIVRFEGMTDPDDEAIVFALHAPDGLRGTYAVAYGPTMHTDDVTAVRGLRWP